MMETNSSDPETLRSDSNSDVWNRAVPKSRKTPIHFGSRSWYTSIVGGVENWAEREEEGEEDEEEEGRGGGKEGEDVTLYKVRPVHVWKLTL